MLPGKFPTCRHAGDLAEEAAGTAVNKTSVWDADSDGGLLGGGSRRCREAGGQFGRRGGGLAPHSHRALPPLWRGGGGGGLEPSPTCKGALGVCEGLRPRGPPPPAECSVPWLPPREGLRGLRPREEGLAPASVCLCVSVRLGCWHRPPRVGPLTNDTFAPRGCRDRKSEVRVPAGSAEPPLKVHSRPLAVSSHGQRVRGLSGASYKNTNPVHQESTLVT